ncbi:hypothetical protein [Streptomyces sp. NPDC047070]|uniref:hypothetical protein n=1 Tax=Streptomyces sp. NPDC047070 TaxID=3154923 RepID=UPI0034561455
MTDPNVARRRAGLPPLPADGATCRRMETRTCPPSYNGPCGTRPCARFESDDPTPWLDTPVPSATPSGIRGLLEHVGIDTDGKDITVVGKDGEATDPAPAQPDVPSVEEHLALLRQAVLDIDAHATPVGQADPDDPDAGPHHYVVTVGALHRALGKVGHTAPACRAEAALARLHEGEEPVTDPAVQYTPGQFIWQWNRATPAERLDVAARWADNASRASTCFETGHERRLEEGRQAWAALHRAREVAAEMDRHEEMGHWVRTLEEALRLRPSAASSGGERP